MLKKIPILISLIITFQSCNLGTSGGRKNDQISSRARAEIKASNDKLMKAMKDKDEKTLSNLFSDSLKAVINMKDFMEQFAGNIKTDNYRILDEYHIITGFKQKMYLLESKNGNINDYQINFIPINEESYLSLLLTTEGVNELLTLVGYGKYNEEWKVNLIFTGVYRFLGKTAPEYYKLAKDAYEASNLVDANVNNGVATKLLESSSKYFAFKNENEMNQFFQLVKGHLQSKYYFPLEFKNVETHPLLFSIEPQLTAEGIFPMVNYKSNINIKDETQLNEEYRKVREEVNKAFKGINENKKYVFYMVYNSMPKEGEVTEQYGFVDTVGIK